MVCVPMMAFNTTFAAPAASKVIGPPTLTLFLLICTVPVGTPTEPFTATRTAKDPPVTSGFGVPGKLTTTDGFAFPTATTVEAVLATESLEPP